MIKHHSCITEKTWIGRIEGIFIILLPPKTLPILPILSGNSSLMAGTPKKKSKNLVFLSFS